MKISWDEYREKDSPYVSYMLKVNSDKKEHWVLELRRGGFRHCFRRGSSWKEVIDNAQPIAASTLDEAKEYVLAVYRLEGS